MYVFLADRTEDKTQLLTRSSCLIFRSNSANSSVESSPGYTTPNVPAESGAPAAPIDPSSTCLKQLFVCSPGPQLTRHPLLSLAVSKWFYISSASA
jgi:hypothetical protein